MAAIRLDAVDLVLLGVFVAGVVAWWFGHGFVIVAGTGLAVAAALIFFWRSAGGSWRGQGK